MRFRKAFTLIELVMVIVIITIIAACLPNLMLGFVRHSVFIPNKLNMDMLASDALRIMVEGDGAARGLRFSRSITNIAGDRIDFVNQDGQDISYRLDATNVLFRSINGDPQQAIPYYIGNGISIIPLNGSLFTYRDGSEAFTANPLDVRRVEIGLIARTGNGSFADWQGNSEQLTSIAVKRYQ